MVGHSGEETDRLFKNLQSEFQRVKQGLHTSGVDTHNPPCLRHSEDLFSAYENYYSLYFPHGGSAVPSVVMTESTVHFFNE
jgi:hypothetical protein